MKSYHGIVTQFIHKMCSLSAFVEVEPHCPLELVSGIQQQHVFFGFADLFNHRGSPGNSGETRTIATRSRVHVGLLHPGVHVVGVEENQVQASRGGHGEAQQHQHHAGSHLSAARKKKLWRRNTGEDGGWWSGGD